MSQGAEIVFLCRLGLTANFKLKTNHVTHINHLTPLTSQVDALALPTPRPTTPTITRNPPKTPISIPEPTRPPTKIPLAPYSCMRPTRPATTLRAAQSAPRHTPTATTGAAATAVGGGLCGEGGDRGRDKKGGVAPRMGQSRPRAPTNA